jgi:hypothetical protein
MAKTKATHFGTCQICGSEQKLPEGVLSLHGYTTRWGFFSGVCSGARHLPFEKSTDLILGAIAYQESAVIPDLEAQAARLHAGELREDGKTFKHHYNRRTATSSWGLVEIKATDKPGLFEIDGDRFWASFHGTGLNTVDDLRRHFGRNYADHLLGKCGQIRQWVKWQRERLANWQPTELKPIK